MSLVNMAQGLVSYPLLYDIMLDNDKEHMRVYDKPQTYSRIPSSNESGSQDMSVTGRRVRPSVSSPLKTPLWLPEASIRLPPHNSYGYRLSFQRSLTETKLLGQKTYPDERRGSVSFDGFACREIVGKYLKELDGTLPTARENDPAINIPRVFTPRQPPPTREISSLSLTPTVPSVSKSQQEQMQRATPADIFLNLKPLRENEQKSPAEMFSTRTSRPEGTGNWRVDSNGTVRRVKTVLDFKTREETTLSNKEKQAEREKSEQKLKKTQLERSYDRIPVMSWLNRTGNDIVVKPRHGGKAYGKSEFALNLNASITKKVLNKHTLPAAFKKNYNTYLKFYGTPLLEEKGTRLFNTPASVNSPYSFGKTR